MRREPATSSPENTGPPAEDPVRAGPISRRGALATLAAGLATLRASGVASAAPREQGTPTPTPLGLGGQRDGLVFAPAVAAGTRLPMVVMLHGAGGSARGGIAPLLPLAAEAGVILLAPESRGGTWDAIRGTFGPDVEFIEKAVSHVIDRHPVDERRLAVAGFSDGASYALSLALMNGGTFRQGIVFSPGLVATAERQGKPRLFVSHGVQDRVLDIDHCSRRIVPQLRALGYDVTYEEFQGGHTVPPAIARRATEWLAAGWK